VTEIAPTPTTYGMCEANNFASTYDGQTIDFIGFTSGVASSTSTDTAYDCCVLCATTPDCGGTTFIDGSCYLSGDAGTCDGSRAAAIFATDPADTNPDGFAVSNGPCGQYVYQSS
jgi:hypothetical protein